MSSNFGTRTKDDFVQPYTHEDGFHVDRAALLDRYPKTPEEAPMPWTSSDAGMNRAWAAHIVEKGVPENKVHEMMVEAQIRAFRDVMQFTRTNCWREDFPKNVVLFELFKTAERDCLEALVARYLVEHGHG